MTRTIALVGDGSNGWQAVIQEILPNDAVVAWSRPSAQDAAVDYAIGWAPPAQVFAHFPRLKAIFALGAGVDRFVGRDDVASTVRLIRLTDAGMAAQMVEYALYGVLRYQRAMDVYESQQTRELWHAHPPRLPEAVRVGVLGLGEMGGQVARALAERGYGVTGWSRSPKSIAGVRCLCGLDRLDGVLAASDVLINILPSTPATRGLLNHVRLARLPSGAALINAGRGDQVDLTALRSHLDSGHLRSALLDVFPVEPLPSDDPVWRHPKVRVTPHIAAETLKYPAAEQIAEKIRQLEAGESVAGEVVRERGY